jgi:adenine-specific DNA-methyltransferase
MIQARTIVSMQDGMMARAIEGGARLLEYALELQDQYEACTSLEYRKNKGQFFTPPEVCEFMAGLLPLTSASTVRLLDPGAGIGALSAAVCDRFLKLRSSLCIHVDLFENDPKALPFLGTTMNRCAQMLMEQGQSLRYQIHAKDFIIDAAATVFSPPSLFYDANDLGEFDAVIMNPPLLQNQQDLSVCNSDQRCGSRPTQHLRSFPCCGGADAPPGR